ncbi:hypothetical protein BT67DRAFT_451075 [Trichocladium antarcticum]|uniref:BTB domain-containing protein n=1 Tax=Trichocladium antarcticum TaxID=1450529 RepID=A0AAN6UGC8_9PEZI|nr:hypothetical protein BT67DRAFT_451075 [Trichocladium antarcticum]
MAWAAEVDPPEGCEAVVRVLVGDEQREFTLPRKLLCDSCAFFRSNVEGIPRPSGPRDGDDEEEEEEDSVLWLPGETPEMFDMFVLWLRQQRRFPLSIDHAIRTLSPDERRTLRTNLIRLHLFAATIDLPALQDAAMDMLQDLYLRLDWDMSARVLAFLYGDCDAQPAVRLRRWAVAMLAWTLHGADKAAALAGPAETLFAAHPALRADYRVYLDKMALGRADVRVKNPQLRLPANTLDSGGRLFGFRQCTFHSHRATVGEGERGQGESDPWSIISPVGDRNQISYLDLS